MAGGDLKQAERLTRARNYPEVIRLLEPQVFRFRESFRFYYLLGMACLRTGDLAGAYSYLRRANQLNLDSVDCLLALAVLHLKRQELQEAIESWLAVQDLEPRNAIAQRGLNFVKQNPDIGRIVEELESDNLRRFLPERGLLAIALPRIFIALAGAALLVFAVPLAISLFERSHQPARIGLAEMNLPESAIVADTASGGEYRYILTDRQIDTTFQRMKSDFADYRDNLVQREANLLAASNAAPVVKDRARLLASYLKAPSFASLRDPFSYDEVAADPTLYRDCYVDWRGRVSNLVVTRRQISFDFLVGYYDERVLEGIVPVRLDFAADIDAQYPLEVLGKVRLDSGRIALDAVSLHQLGPVAPSGGN